MVKVRAGARLFDVDAVVFDKDGTLVDLQASWSEAARRWVEVASGGSREVSRALAGVLGYDEANGRLVPDGIIAAGTLAQLEQATRSVLTGVVDVDRRIEIAHEVAVEASTDPRNIRPLGDLTGAVERLIGARLRLGVLTSDDRATAEANLETLGIRWAVSAVVGGDDVAEPKPDPEGLLALVARLGTAPDRVLMIGDSSADMGAARAAGTAGAVAVGATSPAAPLADVVIASVDELIPIEE